MSCPPPPSLPASGRPIRTIGISPPLLLAHLVPWIELFGTTLRGFYVLYVFWLVLALFCAWRILRMLAPGWLAVAAFASATVVMPATGSLDMFFPSELPGLALVLVRVESWRSSSPAALGRFSLLPSR